MLFKDVLKKLREGANLTQEALAQKAIMSVGNVRNYEQGIRLPTFPVVVKLAKALGVTCEAFAACSDVTGEDQDPEEQVPITKPKKRKK